MSMSFLCAWYEQMLKAVHSFEDSQRSGPESFQIVNATVTGRDRGLITSDLISASLDYCGIELLDEEFQTP